jgi:hypothetical protein
LLGGAKPRIKSRSKNLIRIAQEEVKQGLVDYELVKAVKEEMGDASSSDEEMFIGEEIAPDSEEKPEEKGSKDKEPEKGKKD